VAMSGGGTEGQFGRRVIASELRHHQLRAEILKAVLLLSTLVVLAAVITGFVALNIGGPDLGADLLARAKRAVAVLAGMAVFEGAVLAWLWRRRTGGHPSPTWFRYLNTLVEIGVPTLAIALFSQLTGTLPAINGAIPFVYFLFIGLTALYLDAKLSVFAGVLAAAGFLWLSTGGGGATVPAAVPPGWEALASPLSYELRSVMLLIGGVVAAFVGRQIRRQVEATVRSLHERDRAVSIFGQHVSPQVAELLLRQPVDYPGEERHVCVLFLDIRDFSRIAAERSAAEVVSYLNALFGPLIRTVNEHGGIVNKFLGDGFMAVFGAPLPDDSPCENAVAASRAILAAIDSLARAGTIPATRVGIGLHTGEAVTGNVGSPERKEYTVIGDVVNLASRIEQATKTFGAQLLASEQVVRSLGEPTRAGAEDLGPAELKGQPGPVRLYKLA
jgi:adenylate cyclase